MIASQLILFIATLLGSAFLAGIETGVIAMNRLRLQHLVRRTALAGRIHCRLDRQAGAARRQRLDLEGHNGAGDAQLVGGQTLVLAPPG